MSKRGNIEFLSDNEEPCGKPQGIINPITTLLHRGNPVASHREFSS